MKAIFNPHKPKVSLRRWRKSFGRFTRGGLAIKEHELNRKKEAERVSLENAHRATMRH
jgi:hypothetical protein